MRKSLENGEGYLSKIDAAVKKYYSNAQADLTCCKNVIDELGLPPVFVIPMVHQALLSHLG